VHGIKHAQDAMKRGESVVVECGVCSRRYAVDESAKALYCTACDSVTEVRNNFKGKRSTLALNIEEESCINSVDEEG
jgi:uncharacterized CHY-type Zn-finger protein